MLTRPLPRHLARLAHMLTAALLLASSSLSLAAAWPEAPLHIIVGFPPGSAPDVQARLLAPPLARALGQPVVIDNLPGDGGNLGAAKLAAVRDGHTIGIVGNGQLTSAAFLPQALPFEPSRDFAPLALVASAPLVWVAAKPKEARSTAQFIQQARSQGAAWAYGSTGAGSGIQLGMEELKHALGLTARHVPFANGPAILGGLLGGQIQMAMLPASLVLPLVQSGDLQALAVSAARPTPLAPTLAALEEIGVRDLNIEVWNALVAPATMPAAHRAQLSAELSKVLRSRDVQRALFLQGWRVDLTSPQAVAQRIRRDTAAYRRIR